MNPANIPILESQSWFLLKSGPSEPERNMAVDAQLLETASERAHPVLRFYEWARSAASYGYSQRLERVQVLTTLRPLVRRPTGGGVVPHDADWTYSLVFPPGHWWYALSARDSYRTVHEWLQRAFARLSLPTELAACCVNKEPGKCFVGAEQSDLLWQGRKIAGAAQRRNRQGLLIQGSIQPSAIPVARADWEKAMCATATERWNVKWSAWNPESSAKT